MHTLPIHGSDRPVSIGRLATLLVLQILLFIAAGTAMAQTATSISRAEWRSGDRQLRVEGAAAARASVTLRNAGNSATLGTTTAASDGRWQFRITSPSPVPCRVRATAGTSSAERDVSNRPSNCGPVADTQAPTAPSGLTATAAGSSQINLAWTAATDNVAVTLYRIERCAGATCTNFTEVATATATSFANTGLTASTAYRYRVRAADAAGNLGTYSNIATATTANGGVANPSLSINDVTVAEGGVAAFVVSLSASPASTVTVVVGSAPGTATSPSDFNAVPIQTLIFAAGTTTLSQTISVTTVNDTTPEPAETFTVNLSNATNATIVKASGTGTIAANDFTDAASAHATMSLYDGPQTCLRCHETQARQMHGSVHYQQNGIAPNVTNINAPGVANPKRAGEGPADRPLEVSPLGTPVDSLISINTYCGTHQNSPRSTCANCHVGNGRYPRTPTELSVLPPSEQLSELANVDCMTCHQQVYKRFPAWPEVGGLGFADLTIENMALAADGVTLVAAPGSSVTRTGLKGAPILHPLTKDFEFRPAGAPGSLQFALPAGAPVPAMTITTEQAAQTVHRTTRQSCLNCHAGAAGGNGAKRGDLSTALVNPPVALDMHMSTAAGGASLTCSSCHNVNGTDGKTSHRVRGRGLDLRANDVATRFTCDSAGCHTSTPHANVTNGTALNRHTAKVACQTCHIPTFAKVVNGVGLPTEMARNWEVPVVSQSACNGRGGWLPEDVKASNVRPTYKWFDGTSRVTYVGESLAGMPTKQLDAATAQMIGVAAGTPAFILGNPNGAINVTTAKIYPMKEHVGKLARNTQTNQLVPHSTYEFFRTGSFCRAVSLGMGRNPDVDCVAGQLAPMPSGAESVAVHTYQTINHGVDVKASALGAANQCGNCHTDRGVAMTGGPARLQLSGAGGLGYDLKEPATATGLCNNCHDAETNPGFVRLHDEHRGRSNVTCSSCHLSR
jgi:chitodextrinase